MSWKDLFYFTRAQRNGIIVLLILILAVAFAPAVYRSFYKPPPGDSEAFLLAVEDFEERLAAMQANEEKESQAKRSYNRPAENQPVLLSPFPFNPNHLSVEDWEKMGIPAYVARSIRNYENAGGSFRYKEDVSRLYLVTDEMYSQLEPFILLPSRESQAQEQTLAENPAAASAAIENRASLQVNLNTADTTELMKLYGIGPVFSRRIVSYREKLGGYRYLDQLLEVYGMDSLRLNGIRENLMVDTTLTHKININQAEWADLVRHPYISSNLANSLVAIRKQHGPYQSIADIRRSHLVTDEIFQKVAPYLSVD
ncbi:MAG: helix-hairpin-helix domain-containing protein [Bacteroides sp.]|jgi:competence ComEA-like helix-hairpin-helix protein|nr:helix-hairpin-helix domain-containing protein [Bacteroides sp.]